jgi:hypothetical protein
LTFMAATALILAVPGPSVLFVIGRALAYGRRAGLVSVAGNELGELVLAAAVAFGVGAIVERSQLLFTVMRLAGLIRRLRSLAWRGDELENNRRHGSPTSGRVALCAWGSWVHLRWWWAGRSSRSGVPGCARC